MTFPPLASPPSSVPAQGASTERHTGFRARIRTFLRQETVGGALLLVMAIVALVWANSPWSESYFALRDVRVGVEAIHLNLTVGAWVSDGLLAVFFFLVGLDLKREFVVGSLRHVGTAIVPIVAAAGGVVMPALIYTSIAGHSPDLRQGWAIPTATDIAFAVSVLALVGSHLPSPVRVFLLTLAVVDDLIAIGIIGLFYTNTVSPTPLIVSLITIAIYGTIAQLHRRFFGLHPSAAWLILLPLGIIAWAFMHASGIHATVAGVLLAFTIPVRHHAPDRRTDASPAMDGRPGLAEQFEYRFRPLSTWIAVPLFAFFSAGVALGGGAGIASALADPLAIAILAALVLGKPIGILSTTWLVTRLPRLHLDPALRWADLTGVGLLGGIGFTVSLLVAELTFGPGDLERDHAKAAVFTASVLASLLGALVLTARNRRYRQIADAAVAPDGTTTPTREQRSLTGVRPPA